MSGPKSRLQALRKQVKGTNVDERSLLATDYLNHFNEAVMTLGMIPDMPELLKDAKAWKPKDYQDHFRDSAVADKELAIAAYEWSPRKYRDPFDRTVEAINLKIMETVKELEAAIPLENPNRLHLISSNATVATGELLDVAGAIIHGEEPTLKEAEIVEEKEDDAATETVNQDEIDALFD